MKLTDKTKTILENFSKISNSVYFFAGKTQKVMTPAKTIVAEAEFDEEFPAEFGIYDFAKFLSVLSLFEEPELEFTDKYVTIKDSTTTATYWFTSKELISNVVVPQNKSISLSNVDLSFELSKDDYKYLKSSSSVMNLTNFIIEGDGTAINLLVKDADNDTSNKMSKKVGDTTDTFQYVGDVSNLRMLDDDYDVKVAKAGIIEFASKNNKLKYWVAIRK
jgi:hypothetical protein